MFTCFADCHECCRDLAFNRQDYDNALAAMARENVALEKRQAFEAQVRQEDGRYVLRGSCPLLTDGRCPIYDDRFLVCRNFFCGRRAETPLRYDAKGNCLDHIERRKSDPGYEIWWRMQIQNNRPWAARMGYV